MKFGLVLIAMLLSSLATSASTLESVKSLSAVFECHPIGMSPYTEMPRAVLFTAKSLATYKIEPQHSLFIRHGDKLYFASMPRRREVLVGRFANAQECSSENRGNILRPVPVEVVVSAPAQFSVNSSPCEQIAASYFKRSSEMFFWIQGGEHTDGGNWYEKKEFTSKIECESSGE